MLKSPPIWLKRLVWQRCLLSALVLVPLPTVHRRNKTYTGYMFRCRHFKRRKAEENEVTFSRKLRVIMTCNHDVSTPIRYFKIMLEINLSFAPLLHALCSAAKFCFFFSRLAKMLLKSRLGSKTWRPMTSLGHNSGKRRGLLCVFSSVLLYSRPHCHCWPLSTGTDLSAGAGCGLYTGVSCVN